MPKNNKTNKPSFTEMAFEILGIGLFVFSVAGIIVSILDKWNLNLYLFIALTISSLYYLAISKILEYLRESNYFMHQKNKKQIEELNYNIRQINLKLDKLTENNE